MEFTPKKGIKGLIENWQVDAIAAISVALIALPLSLGIALAAGAPAMAGILSAIVGGVVTTLYRGGHVSVNGPAKGVIAVILFGITVMDDGSGQAFNYVLAAIVISGALQAILGVLKLGRLADIFHSSVIHGLLAAIGIIIFAKQIHVALGTHSESPNIIHQNTLESNILEIQNKDRVDIILANPPFGGKEKANIQENFPIKTGETAYLFLQHFIKKLKAGGRCGVVIKNTFLSNTDNASVALRKQLLEECNLFTILDLPSGTFLGTGVKTVVLFFEKGKPTKKIWYYQLNVGRNMGKTNSLNENDLEEFINLTKSQKSSKNSWEIDIDKISKTSFNLEVQNPNIKEKID